MYKETIQLIAMLQLDWQYSLYDLKERLFPTPGMLQLVTETTNIQIK